MAPSSAMAADVSVDSPIVFVSRSFERFPAPLHRHYAIERAAEGSLRVLETDGTVRDLVNATAPDAAPDTPVDVSGPSVSFDASSIVFAGFSPEDQAWRIYEVGADGTGLRKVSRTDRDVDLSVYGDSGKAFEQYDDFDPVYLPDGRTCCVSTRTPGFAPGGRVRATNLYVVNSSGSDMHRITSERFGGDTPTIDPKTGRIIYSRWWMTVPEAMPILNKTLKFHHGGLVGYNPPPSPMPAVDPVPDRDTTLPPPTNERPDDPGTPEIEPSVPQENSLLRGVDESEFEGVNNWFLSTINPDGSADSLYTGFGMDRNLTMAWRPRFMSTGEVLYLFIVAPPFLGEPTESGLRATVQGSVLPRPLGGPQTFDQTANFPDPRTEILDEPDREPSFFYASAEGLLDGRIVVTGFPADARGEVVDLGDPAVAAPVIDRDIYVQENALGDLEFLFGEADRLELDAVPLEPRETPPVVEDSAPRLSYDFGAQTIQEARDANGTFRFIVENIFMNAEVDSPIATAPPISGNLTLQFFMSTQRDGGRDPLDAVLVAEQEVPASGRIEQELPAGVPLFERLILPDGTIAVGRDGGLFHVGGMNFGTQGAIATCVGCHAGHSQMAVPESQPDRMNLAPSAIATASSAAETLGDLVIGSSPNGVLDRSTVELVSEWIADPADEINENPSVTLVWDVPVFADEVVVYGSRMGLGPVGERTFAISDYMVETFLNGRVVHWLPRQGTVTSLGSSISLDSDRAFDALRVTILDAGGQINGTEIHGALAEIEVFGSVAKVTRSFQSLTRGDADCDGTFDINDTLRILQHMFLGASLCCQAAGDVDGSGVLDISDPLRHLGWMFLGSASPAEPWPSCKRVPSGPLECERDECP